MWKTRVTGMLGIQYPILEGGMTMAGNAELAAAVSNAGGLGVIGSNPGWVPVDKRVENLRKHIRRVKELTSKPFGVNFTVFAMAELAEKLIDTAVEEGVKVAIVTGGSPKLFTKTLKDAGIVVMHLVGNSKHAKTAEAAGVDVVIAEGYEAGGINSPDELTTFVLVPYVVDAVTIPVVAAGGICDSRGFVAALALGAEGVQIGSRFVATKECSVHESFKQAILRASDTDTLITQRCLGGRVRCLRNEYANKMSEYEKLGDMDGMRLFLGHGKAREGQMLGDTEGGEMSIGQVAGRIVEIKSAKEIIEEIINGSTSVTARCIELQNS